MATEFTDTAVEPDQDNHNYFAKVQAVTALLAAEFVKRGITISTAESCTGGMLAAAITEMPGSSTWFEYGVVSYSNIAKQKLLDVPPAIFTEHGAVSKACVIEMAGGALRRSDSGVAVSVSGIAGPDGATSGKPVGTVWVGWAMAADLTGCPSASSVDTGRSTGADQAIQTFAQHFEFIGNRRQVREQAVLSALHGTIARLHSLENTNCDQPEVQINHQVEMKQ